ncbi:MAG: hypothetical protein BTN85_0354 [Candidatus Methanohalarchaeum thermophilum]|uniref:Uncharacterized protein n=1 Tax=Methanohalarchaeum thermophilum TaxID=1903181 RepID=A0A1Q6DU63_METT1|nr:MAG: hypothetical protein BTN85_0354 [Candidatus Methanohalarchaeum thermophilum]
MATAKNEDVDCEKFQGYEEYGNERYVVCSKFGMIPESTCKKCMKNKISKSDENLPDYIL